MKSAWERALEKLDDAGIDRPDRESLSDDIKANLKTVRQKAEAQLAELEIMHAKNLQSTDLGSRQELAENYRRDRERVESKRDSDLAKLRK